MVAELGADSCGSSHRVLLSGLLSRFQPARASRRPRRCYRRECVAARRRARASRSAHSVIRHRAPDTCSAERFRGVAGDRARGSSTGASWSSRRARSGRNSRAAVSCYRRSRNRFAPTTRNPSQRCQVQSWRYHRATRSRRALLSLVTRYRPTNSACPADLCLPG